MLIQIFLVIALVLFALAALNTPSERVQLGWAGAFFLALALALARWALSVSDRITCFLLEPTARYAVSLRRYSSAPCSVHPYGYHNGITYRGIVEESEKKGPRGGANLPETLWAPACRCGYEFTDEDARQYNEDPLYRRSDTGQDVLLNEAPVGAIWWAPWLAELTHYGSRFWRERGGGPMLVVRTPGGDWVVDAKSTNGEGWTWSGEPPRVTATPSILAGDYHGWLRDGVLERC